MMRQNEELEQVAFIQWATLQQGVYPELRWLFHIPNGGYRSKATAARLKAAGVKAGVPDLCLPVPKGTYHGLYIEMKYGKNKPTTTQKEWLEHLSGVGYCTAVCYSCEEAIAEIKKYITGGKTHEEKV